MLPRSQRLPTKLFDAVLNKGRIIHSPAFYLRTLKISSEDNIKPGQSKISIVVPVKVAKKAVVRNRIRRLSYRAVKKIYGSMLPSICVIVFAKQPVCQMETEDLEKEIKDVFVKAGLLR